MRALLTNLVLLPLAAVACDGAISDPSGESPLDPENAVEAPAPAVRATRLTHQQYANSIQDLLGVSAEDAERIAGTFRSDPPAGRYLFGNLADSLEVDDSLYLAYQRAAQELSTTVSGDAALLGRIWPAGTSPEDFIRTFGERVHRRPLTSDEIGEYLTLVTMGPTLYPDLPPEEARAKLALEGFLQSPGFLYRFEASEDSSDGVVPLDGWEIASRLSFSIWNRMPDDELFEAARTGALTRAEDVRIQAERLLAHEHAGDAVRSFHHSLWDLYKYSTIAPAPVEYPDAPDNLAALAETETDLFVTDAFDSGKTYAEMLTSTRTFANADLARIYGLDTAGMDDTFQPVELDPEQRRGFLTQVGFLAAHSSSFDPDPIHRGAFIAQRIACIGIAAPPDMTPAPPPVPGQTNRQTIENHTQRAGTVCASCHATIINPFGFPFESYDSEGAWRTMDEGFPVDTESQPIVNGVRTPVTGALDLIDTLAVSDRVHACYARRWVEFLMGRPAAIQDRPLVERLAPISQQGTITMRDVVLEIVTSKGFLNRSREELP